LRHHSRLVNSWLLSLCAIPLAMMLVTVAPVMAAGRLSDDLAGPLRAAASAAEAGRVMPAAASRLVTTSNGRVQVEVLFRSARAASAINLGAYGGSVDVRIGERVQAWLPAGKLNAVASLRDVAQVRVPIRPVPLQRPISEGVQLTNATAMHTNGITGDGVRVAIIDTGFGEGSHGEAVTIIVRDMAPGADIEQITAATEMEVSDAITHVRTGGFKVAVMSMGIFGGPYNGTHQLSQKVNAARAAGVFWVNAAGNHARRHYEGDWTDRNGDRFHEWSPGDPEMGFNLSAGVFEVYLSWFQTAGSTTNHDYDLVLYDMIGTEIARSAVTQNGDDPPAEVLIAYVPEAGTYNLRIEWMSPASITPNDRFQLFVPNYDIEEMHRVPARSLPIPAEASGAYSIGATRGSLLTPPDMDMKPIDEIEDFSSRGPSIAGLLKPDLSAPDVVTIGGEGPHNPFVGTSAAAPYVAGAAALLLDEDSSRTCAKLVEMFQTLAVKHMLQRDPSGNPVPDNTYGHGRLNLRVGVDTTEPQISISSPRNGETITSLLPEIAATITDVGSGVDEATIVVKLDGNVLVGWDYQPSNGQLKLQLTTPLTRSGHTLTIDASDVDGNPASTAISNFRVSAPSIDAGLHLISLPYPRLGQTVNNIAITPSELFGIPYDQVAMVRWVPGDERESKYHIYPDEYGGFNPPDARGDNAIVSQPPAGLGYFVRLPKRCTLATDELDTLSNVETYNIRLIYGNAQPRGWNLIGNPYKSTVDWGTVGFIADGNRYDLYEAMSADIGITEGVLFDFVATTTGGYYQFSSNPLEDMMEFMRGYWVHVLRDATLVVYNPSVSSVAVNRPRPASARTTVTDDQWTLQLSASSGSHLDPVNYIGVHPEAGDGYDIGLDLTEPPPLLAGVSLYMLQSNLGSRSGHYVRDIRNSLSERQEWDIEVACATANAPVYLSWDKLNSTVPDNVRLILRDLDADRDVYMRTTSGYSFRTDNEPETRRFKIFAESQRASSLAVSGLTTAATRGGEVIITYSLTRAANVTADIRNIAGRPIARLAPVEAAGGVVQTLSWNGRNNTGASVPNGKYLVRLTARTDEGQTVQAIALLDKLR
jgi:hypothetical protein